ncbi:MAG: mechanosensitive ion channel family protein [ANME-2 cluster archaeon]|nr:mechanosensitive ion channel family protein [ANME-2 cluster archaeon]
MADNNLIYPSLDATIVLNIAFTILLAYLLVRIITFLLTHLSERAFQYRITIKMLIPLLKFSIYGFTLYVILARILVVTSEQLWGFGVLLGAAIGFGLKDLFAGVIGGILISLGKPYQVGDKIRIGEYYGEVKDIGLISTTLVTPDDNLVSAPNYMVFTQPVASANAGNREMMVVIDLYVDHDADAGLAFKILKEAVITSMYVYISSKHPVTILIKEYPYYRRLRAKAYVTDLRYEFQFESDVTRRSLDEFTLKGIRAPRIMVIPGGSGPG